jgi:hypothetical protein
MTTTSGGNILVRAENRDMWITPARLDTGSLRRQDIGRIGAGGQRDKVCIRRHSYLFASFVNIQSLMMLYHL